MSTITFDHALRDYVVEGKPLLAHLARHEGVDPARYIPAALSQPGTCDRLRALAPPDLVGSHVALYLCSHCGGYDGTPIGTLVTVTDDTVRWHELGLYSDHDESLQLPFAKVRGYSFTFSDYAAFLTELALHEPD